MYVFITLAPSPTRPRRSHCCLFNCCLRSVYSFGWTGNHKGIFRNRPEDFSPPQPPPPSALSLQIYWCKCGDGLGLPVTTLGLAVQRAVELSRFLRICINLVTSKEYYSFLTYGRFKISKFSKSLIHFVTTVSIIIIYYVMVFLVYYVLISSIFVVGQTLETKFVNA